MNLRRFKKMITRYESFRDTLHAVQLLSAAELVSIKKVFLKRLLSFSPIATYFNHIIALGGSSTLKIGLFPLTVDQTGCGVHNNSVFEAVLLKGKQIQKNLNNTLFFYCIGYRARTFFLQTYRISQFTWLFNVRPEYISFLYALGLFSVIYSNKDLLCVIFNRFYSTFRIVTSFMFLIGSSFLFSVLHSERLKPVKNALPLYLELISYDTIRLLFLFFNALFMVEALLENEYSGLACKVSSLLTAATNTEEYVKEMYLKYNRMRQEIITTQLTEAVTHVL